MRWLFFSTAAFGLAAACGISGCGKTATKNSASAPVAAEHRDAEDNTPNAAIAAALAKLTIEDKALAEKQKVCPVSGEPLGVMGAPIKLDVKGQPVFICCEGCKEKILSNPDEYLAKLKK